MDHFLHPFFINLHPLLGDVRVPWLYFWVVGPADREAPDLFGDRTQKAHISSCRPRFATVFLPLERGDRELSIRAKIVKNGLIQLEIRPSRVGSIS